MIPNDPEKSSTLSTQGLRKRIKFMRTDVASPAIFMGIINQTILTLQMNELLFNLLIKYKTRNIGANCHLT